MTKTVFSFREKQTTLLEEKNKLYMKTRKIIRDRWIFLKIEEGIEPKSN